MAGIARRGTFPWRAPKWPSSVERDAPERHLGVEYRSAWARKYPARLARAMVVDNLTRPLAHVLASPEVLGESWLDLAAPPVIFVANHASHLDTPLVLSVLPLPFRHRTVVAAAADHFFDRRWKAHLWAGALNAIPIERHRVNRRSADVAADLVGEGWNLLIFPEGGRSPDGWFQPFRGGAAYLALRTGRSVVPVHLSGTWRLLPKGDRGLRRGRTTVRFGPPLAPAAGEDARRLGARIESVLARMADEDRSDWWSAAKRAAAGQTPDPSGPDASPWRRAWALGEGEAASRERPGAWAVRHRD
ncbi:MAG: lysophospholipid acyltransferase family protein [Acidimicrobiales bacterium]